MKMKKTLLISTMTCGHCAKRVEEALLAIEGMQSVKVSLATKKAEVVSETALDHTLLRTVIEEAGYAIDEVE